MSQHRRGRGRRAPATPPFALLVGTKTGRTMRIEAGVRNPMLDCRGPIQPLRMAGVSVARLQSMPYMLLPPELCPCTPAIMPDGLVHQQSLVDADVLRNPFTRVVKCPHADEKDPSLDLLFKVCVNCRPEWTKSHIPLDGVWYNVEEAVRLGAFLPRAQLPALIPSNKWLLFRACVSVRDEPWTCPIQMAAEGSLAPATSAEIEQHLLGDMSEELQRAYEEYASDVGLDAATFAQSLWRLFGTDNIQVPYSPAEALLVRSVTAQPGTVFSQDQTAQIVYRTLWRSYYNLLSERGVTFTRPAGAITIEYNRISSFQHLQYAITAVSLPSGPGECAWINILDATEIGLADLHELVEKATFMLSVTFDPSVRHVARYIHNLLQTTL